jgi:MFS family permease
MEQTLTPEESLHIIQKSISNLRNNMREGSIYYLTWGWALILASLSSFFVIEHYIRIEQYQKINLMSLLTWSIFIAAALVVQFIIRSRSKKRDRVMTHLDRYVKIIWILAGMLMGLMVFLSLKVNTYPTPFILGVTAMATAVSGLMCRFRPLVYGSVVFLIAAIVAIYLPGTQQLLVFAVAMAFGYLIPGYLLRTSKNGNNV